MKEIRMEKPGMVKQPRAEQRTSLRFTNLLLGLLFSVASLWLADLVFRHYEQSRLVPQLPQINGKGPINLFTLRYNDSLVERQTGDGEFRILSFGDSFTYSIMEPQWSYNGVLQDRLSRELDDHQFRVINLGEPATGTRHFRAAHDFWSQVLEHQAVLFLVFLGNDVLDDAYIHASVVWAPNEAIIRGDNPVLEPGNRRVPRKFPLRMLDYAFAYWMSARTRSEHALPDEYNWAARINIDHETFLRVNFKYMENFDPQELPQLLPGYEQVYLLLQRAQQISELGTRVAVALGPSEPQVDDLLRAEVLAANNADQGRYDMGLPLRIIERLRDRVAPDVSLINLVDPFRAQHGASGEPLFFNHNTHWSREGNRLAGELIAAHLLEQWFDQAPESGQAPRQAAALPVEDVLVSDTEIDAYLEPLTHDLDPDRPVISGAVRAVHLMDGIAGDENNWAIAALDQPINIEFSEPVQRTALRLHLYDADGRSYRFTVEARMDGAWRMVADHSREAVGGTRTIALGDGLLDALRITGLYNSAQETNPGNAFIHIEELEFIQ